MASQTFALSCIPKLARFNSRTLLPLPPLRTFRYSSSLPMPCLKASYGRIRAYYFSYSKRDADPGTWEEIKDVEHNQDVQSLGKFAVEEFNKKKKTDIKFIRVVKAEKQVVAGFNYRLSIEGEENKITRVFKALVCQGLPVNPPELNSFGLDV